MEIYSSAYDGFLSEFHSEIQILLSADTQENNGLIEATQKLREYLFSGELFFQKLVGVCFR
jgi:hypothetical protein